MNRIKRIDMTGGTVGRGRVADGRADKCAAAGIMTARTRIMRFWGCAYKRIIMAVTACGQCYNNARMAIPGCRMNCAPRTRMTGGTIARVRVAYSGADLCAAAGIMTAGTRIMGIRSCAYQRIIMTVSA